jgi:hypothetical protein
VPESGGHLYVFQQDSAGKVEWIFPQNETSKYSHGANPVAPGQEIFLPAAADRAYVLDDTVGTETFFAYFSAAPLPELERALQRAATTGGGVPELPPPSDHVARKPVTRQVDGRAVPIAVTPTAFQGKGHWIGVRWTIRHVAAEQN